MVLWLAALAAVAAAPVQEVAQAVYARVAPSVLLIVVENARGEQVSLGSGFVIDGNLIVTNAHVVRGGTAFVHTGVAKVPCAVSRIDERFDLAVLRAAVPLTAPALRAAPPNTPIGTRIYALGNPQGLERTITEGLYTGPRLFPDGTTLLQISAAISPGSSGGPVVDSNGLVVGITVSSLESGQNLNFAIPVDTLIELLGRPETAAVAPPVPVPAPTAPVARGGTTAVSTAAALEQFYAILKQRQALRLSTETTKQWVELRKRERDLLAAALNAARHDDDLKDVHSAATNGHNDIALDAATIALQRASDPKVWHYFGIAASAYDFARIVEAPRKTELLQQARDAALKGVAMNGSAKAWLLTGQIHGALKEWPSSKAALNLAMSVGLEQEDRATAIAGLASAARGLNEEADALRWYAELVRIGAATDEDTYAHAVFLTDRGRSADAAALYERLAGNPRQTSPAAAYLLWYSAAYERWRMGEAEPALKAARTALAIAPEEAASVRVRAQAHALIAAVLITRGDPMAEEAGRRSVQIDPSFGWGHTQFARALNVARKAVEAEAVARKAIELTGGSDSEAHFALATSFFFQQRWEESRAEYVRAATLNPKDGHAAFNVGLALVNLGRPAEALPWYEDALRRQPDMPEREQVLAAIAKLKGKG